MRSKIILLQLLAVSILHSSDLLFFSDKPRIVAPLLAAPRDPQMKLSFLKNEEGYFFDPALGGDLGILYHANDDVQKIFSLTARALFAARFQFNSGSFDLWNSDFMGGPQFTYKYFENIFELWLYHQSSHKGPDIVATTGASINYSFESVRFLYSRLLGDDLRLYGGAEFIPHGEPREIRHKTSFRVGGDWHVSVLDPSLYVATDIESKEINGWTLNTSLQVGYELSPAGQRVRRQHLFVNFYHGYSPMGQFFRMRETAFSFGIAMTL